MSAPSVELHVENILADCSGMSATEAGAYMLLILHYIEYGQIQNDHIERITRLNGDELESVWGCISWLFKQVDRPIALYDDGEIYQCFEPNRIGDYLKDIDIDWE